MCPFFTLALLLCVARESNEDVKRGRGDDAVQRSVKAQAPSPKFASMTEEGNDMVEAQIIDLKSKVDEARALAKKFAVPIRWAQVRLMISEALLIWGVGGSAAQGAAKLENAATEAKKLGMPFEEALAHLYAGILRCKSMEMTACEKSLQRCIESSEDLNYASRMASLFLGAAAPKRRRRSSLKNVPAKKTEGKS